MVAGLRSSGLAAALGFPVRNGSIRTLVSPSDSSNAAWPRKRTSIVGSVLLLVFGISALQRVRQLVADRDSHQHPQSRLLGQQGLDRPQPRLALGFGGR